jgi:Fic family protein
VSGAPSPLLCPPGKKAELEAVNTVAQLDYITELVMVRKQKELRESHVLFLHELSIKDIYPCGGKYRDARFGMKISDSKHEPANAANVPGLMVDFIETCNDSKTPALARAAYALWRFNWIHPFAGGNGRTARATSYLLLCMDAGFMLPGVPSIPTLIANNRDGYLRALRKTDAAFAPLAEKEALTVRERTKALLPMQVFLSEMYFAQVTGQRPGLAAFLKILFAVLKRLDDA